MILILGDTDSGGHPTMPSTQTRQRMTLRFGSAILRSCDCHSASQARHPLIRQYTDVGPIQGAQVGHIAADGVNWNERVSIVR